MLYPSTTAFLMSLALGFGPRPSASDLASDLASGAPSEDGPSEDRPSEDGQERSSRGRAGDPLAHLPADHVSPTQREALIRGLEWLAGRQATEPDGSFPGGGTDDYRRVGVSALVALAYMAGGSSPERGPQGHVLANTIEYLLSKVDLESEPPRRGFIHDRANPKSGNHGHGLATLALTQAYSVSPRSALGRRVETALVESVRCIQESQSIDGGWYYQPENRVQHEGSTTIALVQALRAARNVGIKVDGQVIARAVDYVQRSQKEDGSFRYALGREDSSVALTAAAISTLNATGTYSGKVVAAGYDFIWRELTVRDIAREEGEQLKVTFPFYERLYMMQAFWQHSDPEVFQRWYSSERERVLAEQRSDGSWRGRRYGDGYATAVNCLFLALPDGLLPIFQR